MKCSQREQTLYDSIGLKRKKKQTVFGTLDSHTDIVFYASSVLGFMNTNIIVIVSPPSKKMTVVPNQKLYMNREVCLLLKTHNTAFQIRTHEGLSHLGRA